MSEIYGPCIGRQPYFYVIQHVASGKYYAGYRGGKGCHPNELLRPDGYWTSSKVVKEIIEKEGLSSFTINRIRLFAEIDQAKSYEYKFMKRCGIPFNEKFFNRSLAGELFNLTHHTLETRKKQSELRRRFGKGHPSYAKLHHDTMKITNGTQTKWHPKNQPIPDGWRFGSHIRSSFEKLSKDQKGRIHITNGSENRKIFPCDQIPLGWYRGTTTHKQKFRRKWITDGIHRRFILASSEIPAGWHLGKLKEKCKRAKIKYYWFNGVSSLRASDSPGLGWVKFKHCPYRAFELDGSGM